MDNRAGKFITVKISVFGVVQGVGFRPLVYHIAQKHGVTGMVRNVGGFAQITATQTPEKINSFINDIKNMKAGPAKISDLKIQTVETRFFKDFSITDSHKSPVVSAIPPDLSICPECARELTDEKNRRFLNPFISCFSCGPRYTVIESLPYDRDTTSMIDFEMCKECRDEYTSPESRRFHAQTISCNACGPYLIFRYPSGKEEFTQNAFDAAVKIIKRGGIIAVKGIGGYHFACSPFSEETAAKLRHLKGREEKPFAVMFENLASAEEYCLFTPEEKELIMSDERPIVLVHAKPRENQPENRKMAHLTDRDGLYCGAFLPYTPLHMLIIKECGPLIMTSGNISGRPVINDDKEMLSLASPLLDGVLYNTRRIIRPVDDSVAKITVKKPQLIRRSRGYVPSPILLSHVKKDLGDIFAAGGDLKAAFCMYSGGKAVVSQHFGDLEEASVFEEYQRRYKDLCALLNISPKLAACDMHPNYHSARFAEQLNLPIIRVQHHHAHIASVMAEHGIKGRVIGAAFDGTGFGPDGKIWGSEFLVCEGAEYKRVAHLSYTPIVGGDSSAKDAQKTADCFLISRGLEEFADKDNAFILKKAIEHNINTIESSSMGRLFDAVSSLLNIKNRNTYEGEAAAFLEKEATIAFKKFKTPANFSFDISEKSGIIEIDSAALLAKICDLRDKVDAGSIALGFHLAVSKAICKVFCALREIYNTNIAVLSGGVFQNSLLTEQSAGLLSDNGFDVFLNRLVPPNDGGISLGQTYVALHS